MLEQMWKNDQMREKQFVIRFKAFRTARRVRQFGLGQTATTLQEKSR